MTAFIINGIDRVLYAKREGETFSFSFLVGPSIEISNRFVADYERVIRFMTLGIKIRKRQSAALTTDCQ